MRSMPIEHRWTDLDTAPPDAGRVTPLTDATEPRWVGIVDIGPLGTYELDAGWRHDLYVLRGHADVDGHLLDSDDFLIRCGSALVSAGEGGARLLVYREVCDARCEPAVHSTMGRVWRDGRNPLMRVVPLSSSGHRVSLVAWQPGAHTSDHAHPRGEEIFVLSGELRNANERYPAGTWIRLHPGARHEPFAEVPTTILLRAGHLHATAG